MSATKVELLLVFNRNYSHHGVYLYFSIVLKRLFILPIRFYQGVISPLKGPTCRHDPTCSNYTIEAINEWGIFKGLWLGLKRVIRCHPWGTHGFDPVPKRKDVGKSL